MSGYVQVDGAGDYTAVELDDCDRQILAAVALGNQEKQIADGLNISVHMVKKRLQRMFELSGIRTRAGLVWRYRKILSQTIRAGGKGSA